MSKQPRPTPYANAIRPCPTIIQISLPGTIAPPDHPLRTGLRRLSLPLSHSVCLPICLSVCLSLSLSLSVKNNKLFGFTLVSRKFSKTTLWPKFEKQKKLKRKSKGKKSERRKNGEKRHIVYSLLSEEIVELPYEHRCKVLTIKHRRWNDGVQTLGTF